MAGYWRHSASTTVSSTVLELMPANPARVALIIQETGGTNDIRWSDNEDNVADGLGIWLAGGDTIILEGDSCPTAAIYAVRNDSGDATVTVSER